MTRSTLSIRVGLAMALLSSSFAASAAGGPVSLSQHVSGKATASGACAIRIETLESGNLGTVSCIGHPVYQDQVTAALESAPPHLLAAGDYRVWSPDYAAKAQAWLPAGSGSQSATIQTLEGGISDLQAELESIRGVRDVLADQLKDASSRLSVLETADRGSVHPSDLAALEAKHRAEISQLTAQLEAERAGAAAIASTLSTTKTELQRVASSVGAKPRRSPAPAPASARTDGPALSQITALPAIDMAKHEHRGYMVEVGAGPRAESGSWNSYGYNVVTRVVKSSAGDRRIVYAGPFKSRENAEQLAADLSKVTLTHHYIIDAGLVLAPTQTASSGRLMTAAR